MRQECGRPFFTDGKQGKGRRTAEEREGQTPGYAAERGRREKITDFVRIPLLFML